MILEGYGPDFTQNLRKNYSYNQPLVNIKKQVILCVSLLQTEELLLKEDTITDCR